MHIETETAVSAVAISVGMNIATNWDKISDWGSKNGMGAVEVYSEIAELAALSTKLANAVAACDDFKGDGFPGVYAYEVDEPLGTYVVQSLNEHETLTAGDVVRHLGRLALLYFSKVGKPIPLTRDIVRELTGFSQPGV